MNSRTWIALAAALTTACGSRPAQEALVAEPAQPESAAAPPPAAAAPAGVRPGCSRNFASFDGNGDQRLSLEEFLAQSHGHPDPQAVFQSRDADADGSLTELEFCSGSRPGL